MTSTFSLPVEPQLIERARNDDMAAHAALFRMFGTPVFTLARRFVKRRDIAEEILQETFLDVMRRIGSFRNDAPFGFWIRRIAVNRCLMFLRSYWEQQGEPLENDIDGGGTDFDRALDCADLAALLDRLSPLGRAVLWLHEVEGYTHQEIADLTGKTVSFSKSQLARSQQRLRAMVLADSLQEVASCTPAPRN